MTDFFVGLIIVSMCIGSLYGAVYGWLLFGSVICLSGFVSMVSKTLKDKNDGL